MHLTNIFENGLTGYKLIVKTVRLFVFTLIGNEETIKRVHVAIRIEKILYQR